MAEPILKLTRGVPKSDREWMDVFRNLTKFFKVSGDQLQIGGEIQLPELSVGTDELQDDAVTDPKLRNSQACSVIGRSVNSAGSPSDVQASVNGHYLRRTGDVLSFGAIADGDIPSTIARDTEVAAAITAHEAAGDPHPGYVTTAELATHSGAADPHTVYPLAAGSETISGAWSFSQPVILPAYPVGSLPTAVGAVGALVYVSNESGGAVIAFSDGTDWRRVTDRAVVS
jgi:hypothetical protein